LTENPAAQAPGFSPGDTPPDPGNKIAESGLMGRQFTSNRTAVSSCKDHVVWCLKDRRRVRGAGVNARCPTIIQDAAAEMEVMQDHMHLLVSVDPHRVRVMNGRSSRLLCQEFSWPQSRVSTLRANRCAAGTTAFSGRPRRFGCGTGG
jgi:putative transposase